ncbi:MAG TPA: hypothetical protein VFM82_10195 [Flavobacteriaceae bacterium]|nr:hypothetical protein [Flavobacteriaceae bacterium]
MYRKIISHTKKIQFDQHNPRWLAAKRLPVTIFTDRMEVGKKEIHFDQMEEIEFYTYKSFAFFKIYSIFGFKYQNEYFQIGVNNKEKIALQSELADFSIQYSPARFVDYAYTALIFVAVGWLILLFLT